MNYTSIVIEGNIGSGKTTLATKLASDLSASLVLEEYADNPFLSKFYKEPEHYALPLELSFLLERYQQLKEQQDKASGSLVIADYYYIKSLLFAEVNLPQAEFHLYQQLFKLVTASLTAPDLLVYLHQDVERLKQNIKKRGRSYEQNILTTYLLKLENAYFKNLKSLSNQRILIIDINKIDFEKEKTHYQKIIDLLKLPYPIGLTELIL